MLGVLAATAAGCTDDDHDAPPPVTDPIGLNDVSVLLPLPTDPSDQLLLRLDSAGNGGALLARDMFDAIPVFSDNPLPERAYDQWRGNSTRATWIWGHPQARRPLGDPHDATT